MLRGIMLGLVDLCRLRHMPIKFPISSFFSKLLLVLVSTLLSVLLFGLYQLGKIEFKKAEEEHFHGDGSYVYFVGNKEYGFVKIGKSKRVEERFMELQVGCPFDLYLFGVYQNMGHYLEKHFHEKWRPYHVRGEWFRIEGNLEEFLHNGDAVPISALRYIWGRGWRAGRSPRRRSRRE